MTRKRPQTIQNKMTSKWMENDCKNYHIFFINLQAF